MIIQLIIVYIIIAWAAGITLSRFILFFRPAGTKCSGCSGCAMKSIHTRIPATDKSHRFNIRRN